MVVAKSPASALVCMFVALDSFEFEVKNSSRKMALLARRRGASVSIRGNGKNFVGDSRQNHILAEKAFLW